MLWRPTSTTLTSNGRVKERWKAAHADGGYRLPLPPHPARRSTLQQMADSKLLLHASIVQQKSAAPAIIASERTLSFDELRRAVLQLSARIESATAGTFGPVGLSAGSLCVTHPVPSLLHAARARYCAPSRASCV